MLDLIRNRTHDELGAAGARLAAAAISRAHAEGRPATVLLAAAPSQLPVLSALAAADVHDRPVRYFHMDEYVGLAEGAPQAFGAWLGRSYFDRLPAGHQASFERIDAGGDPEAAATAYAALLPTGDFDLVLCGIGINGHLAFNEPGSALDSRTRVVELTASTREANARFFPSLGDVPAQALTQGLGTIREARSLILLASGSGKADAVAAALTGPVTPRVPASVLQLHPDVTVLLAGGSEAGLEPGSYTLVRETSASGH